MSVSSVDSSGSSPVSVGPHSSVGSFSGREVVDLSDADNARRLATLAKVKKLGGQAIVASAAAAATSKVAVIKKSAPAGTIAPPEDKAVRENRLHELRQLSDEYEANEQAIKDLEKDLEKIKNSDFDPHRPIKAIASQELERLKERQKELEERLT